MQPEVVNNAGVALILFLQGLAMAVERMKTGASNWRLHLIIQGFTFLLFPVIGLAFQEITRIIWPSEPGALREGFLYLCVLPSTVSTSVVLTTVAKGNTPGALFNAALSNILGVMFTPLLVRLLMQASDQTSSFGPLLLKITLLTLVPFAIGMGLRPFVRKWIDANRPCSTFSVMRSSCLSSIAPFAIPWREESGSTTASDSPCRRWPALSRCFPPFR